MSFEINDVGSQLIQRSLRTTSQELETNFVKLSTGKKLSAMEDAANLIISEEMESQRRGSQQAAENSLTGMNMLSTAESGLSSINENLQRIRELTIQRENGTLGDQEKEAINSEIGALTDEIDRVSKTTSFNDINLLDGSTTDLTLQIGPDSEEDTNTMNIDEALSPVSSSDLGLDPDSPDFLNQIDDALSNINSKRSDIGAMTNRLESAVSSLYVQNENISAAQSRITDVDVAAETSKLAQNQILQDASASLLAQANQSPSIATILA